MVKRKPKFFCDNCGAQVDMAAKSCPRCGRFFASVRCPKCGYTGGDQDFARGCPKCGYSAAVPGGNAAPPRRRAGEPAGPVPVWLYFFAALALMLAGMLLYHALR
jgi:predicted RNA-binding Zn-ribbon protein involved in translation (DUF1610 family)